MTILGWWAVISVSFSVGFVAGLWWAAAMRKPPPLTLDVTTIPDSAPLTIATDAYLTVHTDASTDWMED